MARRNDSGRRQRILDAALEVVASHGTAATTHRRIAAAAGVPLGSITYYFTSLEALLATAFGQLAERSSAALRGRLDQAHDRAAAIDAVVDIISGSVWAEPRTLLLSYELYAFAVRNAAVEAVMREWMAASRDALGRFFDPLTVRALDALVEGIGIHNSVDAAPLDEHAIRAIVLRLVG